MKTKTLILGAGIGGLAAGAALKASGEEDFFIIEGQNSLPLNLHNGVHYMHDTKFELPFLFDWKKIPLTEQIWWPKDSFKDKASLDDIIYYSKKATGVSQPNSIMAVGSTKEVSIPKSNKMNDLISAFEEYIGNEHFKYSSTVNSIDVENKKVSLSMLGLGQMNTVEVEYDNIISTVPLNKMTGICKKSEKNEFKFQTIFIRNYELKDISPDWFINVYVPDPAVSFYRFSALNKTLSIESTEKIESQYGIDELHLLFNFDKDNFSEYEWKTGKIVSISKDERAHYIEEFGQHNIYLIGRFGLWNRRLLMHTTIKQAQRVVKHIIEQGDIRSLKEDLLD